MTNNNIEGILNDVSNRIQIIRKIISKMVAFLISRKAAKPQRC
jgi:hypothetical protein